MFLGLLFPYYTSKLYPNGYQEKKKLNSNIHISPPSDEIFEQIMSSSSENLKDSQDILNKIFKRELPKFVGEARLMEKNKSKVGQSWIFFLYLYNNLTF